MKSKKDCEFKSQAAFDVLLVFKAMHDENNVNGKLESIVPVVYLRVVKINKLLHFGRCQSEIVKGLERRISGPQMATGAECFL